MPTRHTEVTQITEDPQSAGTINGDKQTGKERASAQSTNGGLSFLKRGSGRKKQKKHDQGHTVKSHPDAAGGAGRHYIDGETAVTASTASNHSELANLSAPSAGPASTVAPSKGPDTTLTSTAPPSTGPEVGAPDSEAAQTKAEEVASQDHTPRRVRLRSPPPSSDSSAPSQRATTGGHVSDANDEAEVELDNDLEAKPTSTTPPSQSDDTNDSKTPASSTQFKSGNTDTDGQVTNDTLAPEPREWVKRYFEPVSSFAYDHRGVLSCVGTGLALAALGYGYNRFGYSATSKDLPSASSFATGATLVSNIASRLASRVGDGATVLWDKADPISRATRMGSLAYATGKGATKGGLSAVSGATSSLWNATSNACSGLFGRRVK